VGLGGCLEKVSLEPWIVEPVQLPEWLPAAGPRGLCHLRHCMATTGRGNLSLAAGKPAAQSTLIRKLPLSEDTEGAFKKAEVSSGV
jgi:hypothetical protein